MEISRSALLAHLDYSAWANEILLLACSTLAPEELNRDWHSSHSNIVATLRHIYYAERVWLMRLTANTLPPLNEIGDQRLFCDPPPGPDLPLMQERWPQVSTGLHDYAEAASEAELAGELRGIDCAILRWRLLMHTVNHATLHRGQVTGMLRQLGKHPPNTDLFSYHLLRP